MPLGARSRFPSTYPKPASLQTSPGSSPVPASPLEDNQTPALPADSPHIAIQIVVPPGIESCCAPVEGSPPKKAPLATHPLRSLPSLAPEAPHDPPTASPASHSPALAN